MTMGEFQISVEDRVQEPRTRSNKDIEAELCQMGFRPGGYSKTQIPRVKLESNPAHPVSPDVAEGSDAASDSVDASAPPTPAICNASAPPTPLSPVTPDSVRKMSAELISRMKPKHDADIDSPKDPISPTSASSCRKFMYPSQTLIFFDWDDTLFPSTEVFDRWGISSRVENWSENMELTEEQEHLLESWREALYQYLCAASALSERCCIVTNARSPWVTDCINFFAPNCRSLFGMGDSQSPGEPTMSSSSKIRVVYARDVGPSIVDTRIDGIRPAHHGWADRDPSQEERDEEMTTAKMLAMRREIKAFYSQYKGQTWKNLISFGDMQYEYDAIQEVAWQRKSPPKERLRTKAFLLWPQPTMRELTQRLRMSQILLPAYVLFDGDIDVDLSEKGGDDHPLAAALRMPELSALPRLSEMGCMDDELRNQVIDELALLVQNAFLE